MPRKNHSKRGRKRTDAASSRLKATKSGQDIAASSSTEATDGAGLKINPKRPSLFSRLFAKKQKPEAASKDFPGPQSSSKSHLNKKLSGEISKLKKAKESKAKKRERNVKLFTIRGFIRVIKLPEILEKAGLYKDPKEVAKQMIRIDLFLVSSIALYFLIDGIIQQADPLRLIMFLVFGYATFFFLGLGVVWLCYLFFLDMKIYNRTKEVEKVFPDFLQLASSNISAGMPIDQALWYAVRPNFGVLAKEIEMVAKNTMAGEDLSSALEDFAKKYDSKVIQRSVSLVLEGLAAGGQLADLLNKIALNIEETRILKRDMAANVTTYVIFISFATIVAAPVLLGLSTELLSIISRITSTLLTESTSSSVGMFSFSFSDDAVSVDNFRIFAFVMLTISSISAACIVNIIQKGKVKDGLGKIPIFILVSVILYLVSSVFIGQFFTNII
ncbi:type II secretion system F family protein [Candidatus Woesearchaeota archaeon]|nr:type II secretion system F family protein [Candidatus Woesearchaeota archaeon]